MEWVQFIFAALFSAYVYVFASFLAGLFIYLSVIELMLAKKYVAENKEKEQVCRTAKGRQKAVR